MPTTTGTCATIKRLGETYAVGKGDIMEMFVMSMHLPNRFTYLTYYHTQPFILTSALNLKLLTVSLLHRAHARQQSWLGP